MEEKKGPLGGLVRDAILGMDDSDQKAVNSPAQDGKDKGQVIEAHIKEGLDEAKPDFIKWFSELSNEDVKFAGGKGASLGEMYNHKFPVPPGFVITAQAYDYFLDRDGLHEKIKEIIEKLDVDDTEELNKASKEIRALIEDSEIPQELESEILESYNILGSEKIDEAGISSDALNILRNSQEPIFVSVRSSATTEDLADASFAGQQESFLNVKGESSLVSHVKRCFSSLYTPRAIYYRNKKGFREALIAVVVQKMIDSEKSGVVFSKDPVKQTDDIALEAVFGLGEGIVSGKINPDNYSVSRELEINNVKVANKKIAIVRTASGSNEVVKLSEERSKQQVLTSSEVMEIADFAIKLEEHYKKPQDIEFAIEHGEVYIIQSRPITTLGKKQEGSQELKGNVILEGLAASPGIGVGTVRIIKSMEDLTKIKKGDILVTEMTNPDMVVSMQRSVAIVTDEGGMTSHAAIVSREMGIPAIVGTSEATKLLKEGMKVTVDGNNGKVYEGEVAQTTVAEIKPAVSTERIKLKVILDLPDFAERVAEAGIKDVGLIRLEGIIASSGKHPLLYEKEGNLEEYSKLLEEGIKKMAVYFNSLWIRASDIRTDEYSSLKGAPEREINPMLGFHGVRFSLKHPEILKAELNAIKEVAEYNPEKNFGIMFPQIISMEEVREAKKYFEEIRTKNMSFGVMIETPASVQIIEDICEHVDFISFGTNDLTQYTLAVDRGEDNVQYLYNELHPAVFSQINKVIRACRNKGVETSICGQAGSKKEMVEFLFRKGINSISVNADAAYEISNLIKNMEQEWKSKNDEEGVAEKNENSIKDVEERAVRVETNNSENDNSEKNKKGKMSQKKYEKFKKWKEKQKKKRQEKRNGSNNEVNKKVIDKKIEKDEQAFQREVKEENPYKENILNEKENLLSNVKISAEERKENEKGRIGSVDDLKRIDNKSEEIKDKIEEEIQEKIEEREKIEDKIEAIGERTSEKGEESADSNKVEEGVGSTLNKIEDNVGSIPKDIEEIGVYNPNKEESKEKQKYNYNFEDFE